MPVIPLGLESYERSDSFQPETRLVNMFLEADRTGLSPDEFLRLQRPGMSLFSAIGTSPIRAIYQEEGVQGGQVIIVSGTGIYVSDGATNTEIAAITDDNQIVSICGAYERVGLVADGAFYASNIADGTIEAIEIPDLKIPVWVDSINSYFIIACDDGTFFWVEPSEQVIDPLNFATAESSPDGLVAVRRLGDELFFFGRSTTEVWQTTGDQDAPFQRAAGRLYSKGCLSAAAICDYDNSLIWVGDDLIVYRGSNVPERVSTHAIEEKLRKAAGTVSAFTFSHDAHFFYVLRIPGQGSFALDASTGKWSEFSTYGETTWRPQVCASTRQGTYLGDSASGKVWLLDPSSNTDDGLAIERLVSATIPINGRPIRNDGLTLFTGCSEDTDIEVRWFDGRDVPGDWTTLAIRAPTDNASVLRLGAATQPVRTFEVRCMEDVQFRLSAAILNENWRRN